MGAGVSLPATAEEALARGFKQGEIDAFTEAVARTKTKTPTTPQRASGPPTRAPPASAPAKEGAAAVYAHKAGFTPGGHWQARSSGLAGPKDWPEEPL